MAGEAARPGAIQLPFQPHVAGAAELRVLHQQLVGTCAQLDVAARRVYISGRPARDQQLAVDPDVETVVTGALQDEAAGLGQVPETVPPGAEEPPRQLRVTLQKVKRHVGCDAIDETSGSPANSGPEYTWRCIPVRSAARVPVTSSSAVSATAIKA